MMFQFIDGWYEVVICVVIFSVFDEFVLLVVCLNLIVFFDGNGSY